MAQTQAGFSPINDLTNIETLLQEIADNTDTSNTNEAQIITELQAIKAEAIAINANTDTLEAKIDDVITELQTGNANLTDVKAALADILVEAESINANTDGIEALITSTNIKLDTLIEVQDKELIYTPVTKINNGADNFYAREVILYDSETGLEVSRVNEYSADGHTWSITLPTGTITIGWLTAPAVQYNINEIHEVTTVPQTFAADTYHSLSYVILTGTADVTVGNTVLTLPTTFSDKYEADTLLENDVVITPSAGGRVIVTTIK